MAWKKVNYGDTLRNGVKGDPVCALQRTLNSSGFGRPRLKVDGLFGGATEHAVRWFQGFNQLKVDGIVGPKTWRELRGGYGLKPTKC